MDPVQESSVHDEYGKIPVVYWMLKYLAETKGLHYFFNIQPLTLADCENTASDIYWILVLDIRLKEKTKIGPRNEGIDQK